MDSNKTGIVADFLVEDFENEMQTTLRSRGSSNEHLAPSARLGRRRPSRRAQYLEDDQTLD